MDFGIYVLETISKLTVDLGKQIKKVPKVL